jgi:winged helix DNA-binding protein
VSDARIAAQRVENHRLARPRSSKPSEIVAWFGAMQAQDYAAAKWAIGLRMADGVTDAAIERVLDDGAILRTHLMRPTWHFVAAADIQWMLELTAPRVHRALAWGHGRLGLNAASLRRATTIIERSLTREGGLTRVEIGQRLARAGMPIKGVRLAFVCIHAELERVICSGPRRGRESTYALLATRAPRPTRISRDEALAELVRRYFQSHGPATIRDFVWWSGLTTADAKRGLDIARAQPVAIDGRTYWTVGRPRSRRTRPSAVHLLPIYDEYLVAYRDLEAVPRGKAFSGVLPQAIVADGQVAGTWKGVRNGNEIVVQVTTGRTLTAVERRALADATARYGRFLELSARHT